MGDPNFAHRLWARESSHFLDTRIVTNHAQTVIGKNHLRGSGRENPAVPRSIAAIITLKVSPDPTFPKSSTDARVGMHNDLF